MCLQSIDNFFYNQLKSVRLYFTTIIEQIEIEIRVIPFKDSEPVLPVDPGSDNQDEQPSKKNEPKVYQVGDTVEISDFHITLKGARISHGNEWLGPDEGEKWVVVDVEVENISNKSKSVSSLIDFALYDQDSYKCDISLNIDAKGSVDGEIGPGRKIAGELTYSVPEDHSEFEFIFSPNLFTFGQVIFQIKP